MSTSLHRSSPEAALAAVCPPGTKMVVDETGARTCAPCTVGFYCPGGNGKVTPSANPTAYGGEEFPCNPGTNIGLTTKAGRSSRRTDCGEHIMLVSQVLRHSYLSAMLLEAMSTRGSSAGSLMAGVLFRPKASIFRPHTDAGHQASEGGTFSPLLDSFCCPAVALGGYSLPASPGEPARQCPANTYAPAGNRLRDCMPCPSGFRTPSGSYNRDNRNEACRECSGPSCRTALQ